MEFQRVIAFLKAHNLDGAIIKCFDGPNEWYVGYFPYIVAAFKDAGLECIPYGFLYGNTQGSTLLEEARLSIKYLDAYGTFCADMENGWNGQGDWALEYANLVRYHGKLWVSTWAQIGDEAGIGKNWLTNVANLLPVSSAFMPQVYSNLLDTVYQLDWKQTNAPIDHIFPSYDLSQEDGSNDPVLLVTQLLARYQVEYVSLWEWTYASADPALLDRFVNAVHAVEGKSMSLVKNSHGENANFVRVSQFLGQHSEYACGPAAVAHAMFTTAPQKEPNGILPSTLQTWLFNEYAKVIGPDTISDTAGSSIPNMETMYQDAGFHYWEMSIDANTDHASDIAIMKACLVAGFLFAFTATEESVWDIAENKNPYFWGPAGTHIMVASGVSASGNILVQDTANVLGSLTGANNAVMGPREYDASKLVVSYGACLQLDWMTPIPSGDPLTWKAGFNAQIPEKVGIVSNPIPPVPPVDPNLAFDVYAIEVWELSKLLLPAVVTEDIPRDTGIFKVLWRPTVGKPGFRGLVLSKEKQITGLDGKPHMLQLFTGGIADWPLDGSPAKWL
jgi:hypothetical protein